MNRLGSFRILFAALIICAGWETRAETFKVAIGEWPPFITEQHTGFGLHTEKVTEAFKSEGHIIEYEFLPWRRSLEKTKRGATSATFSWSYVKDREQDYLYPDTPIDELKDVYFYRKDRFPDGLKAMSFEELKEQDLTVVGISDYWYEAPLTKAGVSFQAVATEEQAWTMLLYGRADFYIENDIVGDVHRRNILEDDAEKIGKSSPVRTEPLFILFTRANPIGQRMLDIWERYSASEQHSDASLAIQ